MSQKRDTEAINFLTLPRELRQKILFESFEHALEQDVGFNTNHAILHYLLSDHRNTCDRPVSAHHIGSWASTLAATHEIVSIDLGYVLEKRLEQLETRSATRQQDECNSPFREGWRKKFKLDPESAPRGLPKREVVSSLVNFQRWTQTRILYGPWDEYCLISPQRTWEETLEHHRIEMQQRNRQAQRKKMLTGMVRTAVCLDNCHHVPRKYCQWT